MATGVDPSMNGHVPDSEDRVLDALGHEFSAESLRVLSEAAICPEDARRFGIRAVALPEHVPEEIDRFWVVGDERGPGMLFEWRDLDKTVPQFRPDTAIRGSDGKDHKYVVPSGCGTFLSHLREPGSSDDPVLFVEGSKQGVSAASWAPDGWGVVAVPGCNNWLCTDLTWADGRRIIVLFDADFATNRDVFDAAVGLKEALEVEGADEVVFARLAGARAKEGLDDVLGRRPKDKRTSYIKSICDRATDKTGRAPGRGSTNKYMGDHGLLSKDASLAVLDGQPAALAAGGMIALYRAGVFRIDFGKEPLIEKVKDMLGNEYRPQWRQTIEEFLIGELSGRGMRVRDKEPDPLLDPSRTPLKSAFLFGPTHSGKSTFLRIMMAVAGQRNTSAVTLHQLSDDRFMSAELYQKILNSGSDLSSSHVDDVSLFKRLTGEDSIHANRKYGKTFTFTNRALFAFSAKEIPTVAETSRAYVQRIAAFRFGSSFAGREKPEIEEHMIREELPGILARWAGAWRRFSDRGIYLPPDLDVQEEFETSSDRVTRWVTARCDIHPKMIGKMVGADQGDSVSSLYTSFKIWARDDGPANVMSRPKFSEKLRTVSGVGEVRLKHRNKNLGLNVTTHTGEDRERIRIRSNKMETDTGVWVGVGSVGAPLGNTECANTQNDLGSAGGPAPCITGETTHTTHTSHTVRGVSPGSVRGSCSPCLRCPGRARS